MNMVREQIERRGVTDPAVLEAMRRVPRHKFVPPEHQDRAYDDNPLPIGHDQTISQPYIVGLMTELLHLDPGDKVLEVGTGSGYQTAILAVITPEVYSIEIVPALYERTRSLLAAMGLDESRLRLGDGHLGWPEQAPFAGILVTAAAPEVPPALVEQLAVGGKLVIPVGPASSSQELLVIEKTGLGQPRSRTVLPVRFVPLTGGQAGREGG